MSSENQAPSLHFNLEPDQVDTMNQVELQGQIDKLQMMIINIRNYAQEHDLSVSGGPLNITSYTDTQNTMIHNLENQIETLQNRLNEVQTQVDHQSKELTTSEMDLRERQSRILAQKREIDDKRKLVSTRDRMLQLSIEKNVYKKKVIYSLISAIIVVFILMLLGYSFMARS